MKARALQSQLPFPVVHIEADRMFPRLPEAHPRWVAEERHDATVLALHQSIAAWAASGFDLIVDGSLPYGMLRLRSECLRVFGPSGCCWRACDAQPKFWRGGKDA